MAEVQNISDDIKVILNCKVTVAPENVAEYWRHFKPAFDKVVAEPECRYFLCGENPAVPGELWYTEGWSKDVTWLEHEQLRKKEYYTPYKQATEPLLLKPRWFEVVTPDPSMNIFKLPSKGTSS